MTDAVCGTQGGAQRRLGRDVGFELHGERELAPRLRHQRLLLLRLGVTRLLLFVVLFVLLLVYVCLVLYVKVLHLVFLRLLLLLLLRGLLLLLVRKHVRLVVPAMRCTPRWLRITECARMSPCPVLAFMG